MTDAEDLYRLHRPGVFRFLSRSIGLREAADLTQDVFLRISKSPVPAGGDPGRRAWVFRIARNVAIDYVRRTQRQPEQGLLEDVAGAPDRQDVAAAVHQALATLADLDRDVFLLRETGGLSYSEIAETCDLSPDAVRSRIHRARLELRAVLTLSLADRLQRPLRRNGLSS
jgi:RNA polymerase sigma-70 factor (ECF subfamily)